MLLPSEQGFRSLSNSQIHSDRRLESGFKREEEGQVCLTQRKVLVGTGQLYLYLYLNQNHFFMRRVGSKERGTGLSDASESVGGNLLAGGLVGGMRVGPACSLLTRGQLVKMLVDKGRCGRGDQQPGLQSVSTRMWGELMRGCRHNRIEQPLSKKKC